MKKFFRIAILLAVGVIPITYNACGMVNFSSSSFETIAGNPDRTNASDEIIFAICSVLDRCTNQVPFDVCLNGAQSSNGIGQKLGLLPGADDPFSNLVSAEQSGLIVANAIATTSCADGINNLSCSDPAVLGAYNPTSSTPFANLANMVTPASCVQVFQTQNACTPANMPSGQEYVVNDLGDGTDANPGDHVCATASGTCTLRAAIVEADADGAGTFNIVINNAGTISLASVLPLKNNFNIYGSCNGQTILDGGNAHSIMSTQVGNLNISLQAMRFQNSSGAAFNTGFNAGNTLSLNQMYFANNVSTNAGAAMNAWNVAAFNCTQCVFDTNQDNGATSNGGAIYLAGGAVTIKQSLFVNNKSAVAGGAIYFEGGPNKVTDSTFFGNSSAQGGALNMNSFGNPATTRSLGGNLIFPASTCAFNQASDISIAPNLGPLQNNGGFSNSLSLLSGSPGIDVGTTNQCTSTDQRGVPRMTDGKCDIGAFESP